MGFCIVLLLLGAHMRLFNAVVSSLIRDVECRLRGRTRLLLKLVGDCRAKRGSGYGCENRYCARVHGESFRDCFRSHDLVGWLALSFVRTLESEARGPGY